MSYVVVNNTAKNFDGSRLDYKIVIFEDLLSAERTLGSVFVLDCINQMIRMEMGTSARMAHRYKSYEPRLKLDDDEKLLVRP